MLIINLFDQKFIDKLKFDDCTVFYISKYIDDRAELGAYIMEELEQLNGKKFDLIIANPPYGKIGANITKKIIDTIDFDDYINLLPANDYKRNDTHDLYQHVDIDSMQPINAAFTDAAVTTHMARITKRKHTYVSWDEFEIENYTDKSLKKYFYEERKRTHYAIKNIATWVNITDNITNNTSVLLDHRCVAHKHLAYSKNTTEYKWNVEKSLDMAKLHLDASTNPTPNKTNRFHIDFNTAVEKDNFVKFIYSTDGFRFIAKLFVAANADSTVPLENLLPKADWTRSWTVEEILKDYGYTSSEIQEVMDDLVNFKGMED